MEEAVAKPKRKRGLPEHLNVPWTIGDIVIFLVVWVALQVAVVEVLWVLGKIWPAVNSFVAGANSGSNVVATLSIEFISYILGVLVIWYYLNRYKVGLKEVGWRSVSIVKTLLWAGGIMVGVFILTAAALTVVSLIFPGFNANQPQDNQLIPNIHTHTSLAVFGLVLLPPFFEETIFRGFLFAGFAKKWGVWIGAILSSALFGLAHGQANTGVYTFVLGLLLCFTYTKTKSIYPGIGIHMINNLLAFIALYYK
jgi:CAAX protease family protein